MEPLERFVVEENISRYVGQLAQEGDSARRTMLYQLLITEGQKCESLGERLELIRTSINNCEKAIARHKGGNKGDDPPSASPQLQNLVQARDLLVAVRDKILAQLAKS